MTPLPLCLPLLLPGGAAPPPAVERPNIILILADDLGWADLGVHGCRDIPTPHLDALAQQGVRFTDAYAVAPVSSPSRAGLLTGRYPQRFGFELNPGPPGKVEPQFGLPRAEPTLSERLEQAGYVTFIAGKWHLGYREGLRPWERGFQQTFGFLGGAHAYLDFEPEGNNPITRNGQPVPGRTYTTDAFTDEACTFIRQASRRPFFIFMSHNAVHEPLQATPERLARVAAIQDPKRRTYAAMMVALDDSVGRIRATLAAQGLDRNTLVIFNSDNGGPTARTTSSNAPFRGTKGQVHEGGIRVPLLAAWPGHLPAGKVIATPVTALDFAPTFLEAAGQPAPKGLDGVSLLPWVGGRAKAPARPLFWRFGRQWAIRQGAWKLSCGPEGQVRLFNLEEDPTESRDRSADQATRRRDLQRQYEAWASTLQAPAWGSANGTSER